MTDKRSLGADVLVATVLAAASLALWIYLLRNPIGTPIFNVASGTFPTVLALLLFVLSAGLAATSLVRMLRATASAPPAVEEDGDGWRGAVRLLGLLALGIGFAATLKTIGFLISGSALVLGTALLFGNRRIVAIALMVGLAPLTLSLFFEKFMVIYLPAGELFR